MSNVISIQALFCNNKIRFCPHRDYVWRRKVVETLLSDINRALETDVSHYLGTIIISKAEDDFFEVIDGQQRLLTVILIFRLFLNQLSHAKLIYRQDIETRVLGNLKEDFGRNTAFVTELFANQPVEFFTTGEERLTEAYSCISELAKAVFAVGGDALIQNWLKTLLLFEVIPHYIDRNFCDTSNL